MLRLFAGQFPGQGDPGVFPYRDRIVPFQKTRVVIFESIQHFRCTIAGGISNFRRMIRCKIQQIGIVMMTITGIPGLITSGQIDVKKRRILQNCLAVTGIGQLHPFHELIKLFQAHRLLAAVQTLTTPEKNFPETKPQQNIADQTAESEFSLLVVFPSQTLVGVVFCGIKVVNDLWRETQPFYNFPGRKSLKDRTVIQNPVDRDNANCFDPVTHDCPPV